MPVDGCENIFTEMKEMGDKQGHWMGASVSLKVLPSGQHGQWSAGTGLYIDALGLAETGTGKFRCTLLSLLLAHRCRGDV